MKPDNDARDEDAEEQTELEAQEPAEEGMSNKWCDLRGIRTGGEGCGGTFKGCFLDCPSLPSDPTQLPAAASGPPAATSAEAHVPRRPPKAATCELPPALMAPKIDVGARARRPKWCTR
mmetsp:Transcript_24509/g.69874  ORF Transcript_24509/g.69874 Transcript_24509/m.69874 type:complete len:119 (-) Transcript_24509:118-474(-)